MLRGWGQPGIHSMAEMGFFEVWVGWGLRHWAGAFPGMGLFQGMLWGWRVALGNPGVAVTEDMRPLKGLLLPHW